MGKISKAILMLEYLNTGNKYSVKELSEKLQVTERMVRYYKKELEEIGIYIESFMGPNGGYFLLNNNKYSYIKFNKYDLELLESVSKELENKDFKYLNEYEKLIKKMKKIYRIEEEKSKYITNFDYTNESDILNLLKRYINSKEKIEIIYEDYNGNLTKRSIHPLQIYKYDNKTYLTAFCELRNDIRQFEVERISIPK